MPPRARPTRGRKAAAAATPDDPAPEVAPPAEQELKPEPLSDTVAPEATLTETPAEVPVPEPEVEAPATAPAPPPLFAPTAADFDNSDDEPLPDSPPLDKPKPAWQAALPAPIAPMMRGRSASKSPKKSSKRTPGASQSPTKKRSTKSGSKSSSEAPGITPIANMAPPPRPRSRADQPAEESEVSDDDHDAYSGYDTDDDPVIRTYDVFTTSELAENLYVFQYPVRSAQKPYRKQENCCPIEARLKPKCKVVEIDVPVNVHLNYDEQKGRNWGEVLRKAKQAEGGIAGKATVGAKGGKRRKVKEDDEEEEEPDINYMDFEDAVKKKRILAKQTLGSKMHPDQPKYMLGVFKDGKLNRISTKRPQANNHRRASSYPRSIDPPAPPTVPARRCSTCAGARRFKGCQCF